MSAPVFVCVGVSVDVCVCVCGGGVGVRQGVLMVRHARAGHFRYFLIFSIIKNYFLHFLSSSFDWEWAFKIGLVQK